MTLSPEDRRTYNANPWVRRRLAEFLGGEFPDESTAVYFTAESATEARHKVARPLEELPSWLEQGSEPHRSLWDRRSLLCHLDVEYVNFDHPAYAFLEPERPFRLQEPVVAATLDILARYGIIPLHLLTGRGHHFVRRILHTSEAFVRLSKIGHLGATLSHLYATALSPTGEKVEPKLGAAFSGLGLAMEFLANEIRREASAKCECPIELGAIEAGPGENGREIVSVDITEYADPLCSREIRIPFSVYLKPAQLNLDLPGIAPIFCIPMLTCDLPEALRQMHDAAAVTELARASSVTIPDFSEGMQRLVATYEESSLASFHHDFYSQQHDAPGVWAETYDRTPLEVLPPCTRLFLEKPNDLLLRPACARRVVRVMLALGWHPRHIAGLIRSKYERDFEWRDQWKGFDPATRADFYARLFAGMILTDADQLIDFNCQSAREAGICAFGGCGHNLQDYQQSIEHRRAHERLARRPFNRLFLPAEHS